MQCESPFLSMALSGHIFLSQSSAPLLSFFSMGMLLMSSFWHQGEAWLCATLHFPL